MHCKFLKLTNGDDIIVQTDDTCESLNSKEFINVVDPVLIASIRIPRGPLVLETYTMQPWIKMAKADVVQIPTRSIVVAVDVHDMAEKQYLQYVEESNSRNLLTETAEEETEQEEMTEEEAFDEFMQMLHDSDEEDDGNPRPKTGRTLH